MSSLVQKLRIQDGSRIAAVNAPPDFLTALGELPPGASVDESLDGAFDVVHGFYTKKADLEAELSGLKAAMKDKSILWIAYPKGTAKRETDLNRDILREFLLQKGLQAVSLVSINGVWSAMRFKRTD
jgi:hypothetical protein